LAPADGKQPVHSFRSASARQMLRDHPAQARHYLVPVLRCLNDGDNPLHPPAGDVYRAFADVPPDPAAVAALRALLPHLAHRDPAVGEQASAALDKLGRPGVRAAMALDPDRLPAEAGLRTGAFLARHTYDPRP